MPTLAESCLVLSGVPSNGASPWSVGDDGTVARIVAWDATAIGRAQPTTAEIAAVTDAQVAEAKLSRVRLAALTGLLARSDEIGIGVRIMFRALGDLLNQRRQGVIVDQCREIRKLAPQDLHHRQIARTENSHAFSSKRAGASGLAFTNTIPSTTRTNAM